MLTDISNSELTRAVAACLKKNWCSFCPLENRENCFLDLYEELACLVYAYRTDDEKLEILRKVLENEK